MDDQNCDCCEGTQILTPASVANRPGLSMLSYRVGTHASFLETMKARLSNMAVDIPNPDDPAQPSTIYPLANLTTRAESDPALAFLDGWATIADVLTFYQERIANEGFLRTATERRSVLELARLIGYALRPGVAASVFLALDLDKDHDVLIQPHEIKAQNIPGPGELPQTFENNEELDARSAWNRLQPRMARPQTRFSIENDDPNVNPRIYVKGISANLKANDAILLTGGGGARTVYHVASAVADPANNRTLVTFQKQTAAAAIAGQTFDASGVVAVAKEFVASKPTERAKVRTEMAQRVVTHLNTLVDKMQAADLSLEASQQTLSELLAKITEERDMAVGEQYARLTPWLDGMIEKLNEAHRVLLASASTGKAGLLAETGATASTFASAKASEFPFDPLKQSIVDLTKRASLPPRNTLNLDRNLSSAFGVQADIGLQMSAAFDTKLSQSLPGTLANVQVTDASDLQAYVFRAVTRPFGHNAPLRATVTTGNPPSYTEWLIDDPLGETGDGGGVIGVRTNAAANAADSAIPPQQAQNMLFLDGEHKIQSDNGWVVVEGPNVPGNQMIINLADGSVKVSQQSLAAYGISGKTTLLTLILDAVGGWLDSQSTSFAPVRTTVVYAESELLPLADVPMQAPICDGVTDLIELDELYSGMQSGRWVVISGERTDVTDGQGQSVASVKASELVMLAEVVQDVTGEDGKPFYYTRTNAGPTPVPPSTNFPPPQPLPGDRTHTWIRLAKKLEFCYQRDKVSFYGNVLKASHGETRKEILGNGDASQAFQAFTLKQFPLTYTSSPTPAGAESTLDVYVNDVLWHETDSLSGLAPTERKFITKTDDASKTTVIFGNGLRGARLPTGPGNVRAEYRNGIGQPGNVPAEKISLLMAKPLGVQTVINPLRASGGADRESMDTARKNAPLTVTALDRLVSVTDYADFARTFAGVGKSVSSQLSDGRRQVVQVTIAGANDIPIDETSDLFGNLLLALRTYGDPDLPIVLQVRELLLLVLSANIRILPDYQWEPVTKAVRSKLLDAFSFERRELGQDVLLSEVIAAVQSVRGVDYVDVDILGGIPEKIPDNRANKSLRRLLTPQEISLAVQSLISNGSIIQRQRRQPQPLQRVTVNLTSVDQNGALSPAQLAYLTPTVADTLVLNQVK